MKIGEEIRQLCEKIKKLEADLIETKDLLHERESVCTHDNTTQGQIVIRVGDGDIRHPIRKCLNCGTVRYIRNRRN